MPKNKNITIKYTSRDFDSIKEDLVDYAKRYYPDSYKDFTDASFGSLVLDTVSYVGDVLSYYLDYNINESFLDTAIEFDNVRKHARSLGYEYTGIPSSYGTLTIYILCPSNAEGTAPDLTYLPTLKQGSVFTSDDGVNFTLTSDVLFNDSKNDFIAARFDEATGATTYFAVRATGIVESGIDYTSEISLGSEFEKFKRIRIGGTEITDITSVFDSEGNQYYEVNNLSQEVIFIETTNKNALTDGVRSIIKPFVATRRFIVQRDDTGTYIQFGFGSESEDTTGLVDPSKIALNLHGKRTISDNSFDPTKLLSTNKLGISPYNTTLTINYRSNSEIGSSIPANAINNISFANLVFDSGENLNTSTTSIVENSLEITNDKPITSVNENITLEELKQRTIANYASQSRAVSKQDYESLVYNMPSKFGAIKRANIVNDPSSTNRRLALYVISENSTGNLAATNSIVKNNLKNWLTNYKMLNDIVDIMDARIINFSVDFLVHVDKRYDSDVVLVSCINAVQNYFSEVSYVGEPVYISRIYQILNETTGVIDTKDVVLENKSGGDYSSIYYNFEDALSKDGTYIKIPKDGIAELKYPDQDVKGTVK
tara:strand:- start:521 stop:2317 length:1797 start_codon:yes stop_codon:yes gene_type:complete